MAIKIAIIQLLSSLTKKKLMDEELIAEFYLSINLPKTHILCSKWVSRNAGTYQKYDHYTKMGELKFVNFCYFNFKFSSGF